MSTDNRVSMIAADMIQTNSENANDFIGYVLKALDKRFRMCLAKWFYKIHQYRFNNLVYII